MRESFTFNDPRYQRTAPDSYEKNAYYRDSAPPLRRLADSLKQIIGPNALSASPVLLCQSPARYHLRRWLEPVLPGVRVIAPAEIPPDVHLRPAGVVR